ncbi:hypothetical protein [Nitrobacter sp. TKz-YC02]|uniref:hypothetical protein n=1 Tax=Nitrobacter sp. TKz-YC02 TaxID=3398704 RepID=UPI003CF22AC8
MAQINEERVVWNTVFTAKTFDFRGRLNFCRFDECTFVKCTLLIDPDTEQIAFTNCTFQDCNVDGIEADEARGIASRSNTFERPLDEQRQDFEERLNAALSQRPTSRPS